MNSRTSCRLLAVVLFAFWCLPFARAGSEIIIPLPDGFVEGTSVSEVLKNLATAGLLPTQKPYGVYLPLDALAVVLKTGSWPPSPLCKAVRWKEFDSEGEAKVYLAGLKRNMVKEAIGGEAEEQWRKGFYERLNEQTAKILKEGANAIKGMTFVGFGGESDSHSTVLALVNMATESPQGKFQKTFAVALGYMVVNHTLISYNVLEPFDGASSVESARNTQENWRKAILRTNAK